MPGWNGLNGMILTADMLDVSKFFMLNVLPADIRILLVTELLESVENNF